MEQSGWFSKRISIVTISLGFLVALAGLLFLDTESSHAQTDPAPNLSDFQKVVLAQGTELGEAMELTVAPDGRVFFINRAGDILLYEPETRKTEIIMNNPELGVWSGLEDGGLGITLDPNFEQNNYVYVYYAPLPENYNKNRLSRFTLGPDNKIAKSSEKILIEVGTQRNICCHSAGSVQFGPDGNLYFATGDNTSSSDNGGYSPHDERPGRSDYDAQKSSGNTNDLRGKIIRIKPLAEPGSTPGVGTTYTIPEGNLFGEGGEYPDAKYPDADASKSTVSRRTPPRKRPLSLLTTKARTLSLR